MIVDDKSGEGVRAEGTGVSGYELAAKEAVEMSVVEFLTWPHRWHRPAEIQQIKLKRKKRGSFIVTKGNVAEGRRGRRKK